MRTRRVCWKCEPVVGPVPSSVVLWLCPEHERQVFGRELAGEPCVLHGRCVRGHEQLELFR